MVKVDAKIKISKGKKSIELTLKEAKDLFEQLNEIVGEKLYTKVEDENGRTK